MHDGFRSLRCFSLQTKFFKPFHRLPLNLGSNFVVWLPLCEITHRSDQCHYRGLAQGFAGLKTVQPVEKNELPILIAADQDWSLLTHLEDALSDAFHHYGIKTPSPFNRNVNLVDWDVFWLAHDCRIKAENFDERNSPESGRGGPARRKAAFPSFDHPNPVRFMLRILSRSRALWS